MLVSMLALETRGSGFQPPVSIPASTPANELLQLGNFRASNVELPVRYQLRHRQTSGSSGAAATDFEAKSGICVVLGDPSCELAIEIARESDLLVYVQLPGSEDVDRARRTV
ncbi:MAG: hypothetical protein ABIL62_07465 [Planctomycetota bacterium]